MIKYAEQHISENDVKHVLKTIKSDFLTQGPLVEKFENTVTKFCRSKYGVAVNSATSALYLAYKSLGVSNGDIIWTSPITFVSTVNAAVHCNAKVDFVDIDIDTFNISIDLLTKKLEIAKLNNTLPKVITPVHLGGSSPEMKKKFINYLKNINLKF